MAAHPADTGPQNKHSAAHDSSPPKTDKQSAVSLARRKIDAIYKTQKTMTSELESSNKPMLHESKHQRFMRELSTSGKSLADIQVEWHAYYAELSDTEKHEVWQEFYDVNSRTEKEKGEATHAATKPDQYHGPKTSKTGVVSSQISNAEPPRIRDMRRPMAIKKRILDQVKTEAKKPPKSKGRQKFESLFFGLAIGGVAVLFFLFSFFNEYVIAPFIQPSRTVSNTPIILATDGVAPNSTPEVIIPKIGVQIPVDYSLNTVDEATIQGSLNNGVTHYANTVKPGEIGNTAIFGHSSNNIFNKGKYKFAFVLLHKMAEGDTFYLTNNGKVYAYRVFQTKVINPDETWVLGPVEGKTATATLITCDPPGTTTHRLVVWGEQISPDPTGATQPATPSTTLQAGAPVEIAGKGPGAWSRIVSWVNPFN